MTRKFKLAIVRARHDTSVAVIADQVCFEMFWTGQSSVLQYWEDTTHGWLDFVDSALMPWVDIVVPPTDTSRGKQAQLAFAALRAANPGFDPLAGFDGAMVVTYPGQMTVPNPQAGMPGQPATVVAGFDGGSTTVGGLPTAVIPVLPSDHTFMCHELGHVLGFDHTFGLDNNGTDWNPGDATVIVGREYGSPYDLMSSAAFASRWLGTGPMWSGNPTFVGSPVAGWPAPGAFSMGPHLARANLHRWFPESLDPAHAVHRPFPDQAPLGARGWSRRRPLPGTYSSCTRLASRPRGWAACMSSTATVAAGTAAWTSSAPTSPRSGSWCTPLRTPPPGRGRGTADRSRRAQSTPTSRSPAGHSWSPWTGPAATAPSSGSRSPTGSPRRSP